MAKKVIYATLVATGVSSLVTLISLFLPFHKLTIAIGGVLGACRIRTYVVRAHVKINDSSFCSALEAVGIEPDFCDKITSSSDLQAVAAAFCQPLAESLLPNACSGLLNAYRVGVVIVIFSVASLVANGFAAWLYYQYMAVVPKKQYRMMAIGLQGAGAIIVFLPLLLYFPLALQPLEDIQPRIPMSSWIVGKSRAGGTSKGYGGMWAGLTLQVVSMILGVKALQSGEGRYEEAREHERFITEMQMYSTQATPHDQQGHPAFPQAPQTGGQYGHPPCSQGAPQGEFGFSGVPAPFMQRTSFQVGVAEPGGPQRPSVPPSGWGTPWGPTSVPEEDPVQQMDRNGDGALSTEEFARAFGPTAAGLTGTASQGAAAAAASGVTERRGEA